MRRSILISIILTACSSAPDGGDDAEAGDTSTGDEVVAEEEPAGDVPEQMTRAELDALVAAGTLREATLGEPITRTEIMPGDGGNRVEGDSVFVTSSAPMGHSTTVYVDGDRQLWFVVRADQGSFPEGVSVSATRIYEDEYPLPEGRSFGGIVQLND